MFWRWSLRGQFSCPSKKIDKKPAQGALPNSRPLKNPPAAPPELLRNVSGCYGWFYRKFSDRIRQAEKDESRGSRLFSYSASPRMDLVA